MPSLFFSFSAEDAGFAQKLATAIASKSAEVLIDAAAIDPGEEWADSLRRALDKASALVLLLPSDAARYRNHLWFEAGAAKILGKRVLAVLPPGRHLPEVPGHVADVLILDADRHSLEVIAETILHSVPSDAHEPLPAMS